MSRSLTTTNVARDLGVHPTSVLRRERRERLPGPEHIAQLARAAGVRAPRLLDRRSWAAGELADVLVTLVRSGSAGAGRAVPAQRVDDPRLGARSRHARPSSRRRLERLFGLPEGALLIAYPAPA
jgi:transcriptional regulator with XRE-family HTH domain